MKTNNEGIALIKEAEGCALQAYPDPATGGIPWTIGYGSTKGVFPGMKITQGEAESRLIEDVTAIETALDEFNPAFNENQYSAFVCFAYNIKHWADTPIFESVLRRDWTSVMSRWPKYCKADGKEMPGLLRRRIDELALFKKPPLSK